MEIPDSLLWNPLLTSYCHGCRTSAQVGTAHEKGPGCLQLPQTQCWAHQLPQDARTQLLFLGGNLPREASWGRRNLLLYPLLLPQPTPPNITYTCYGGFQKTARGGRESEGRNIKRALWGQSPERALNWEFQVENCCHLATHSGSAC